MKFVVVSHTHLLLATAWRLKSEGHEVSVVVAQDESEAAWSGLEQLPRLLEGADKRDADKVAQAAREPETLFVTDSRRWARTLREAGAVVLGPQQLGREASGPVPRVTFGAWFDGAALAAPHLLVEDQGLWPGGGWLGPRRAGGLTLTRAQELPSEIAEAMGPIVAGLATAAYRGLVRFAAQRVEESRAFAVTGLWLDWGWLHTQAFTAALDSDLGMVLAGEASPELRATHTVVLPVSMAPWPGRTWGKARRGQPRTWPSVEVPAPVRAAAPFFMGIRFDQGRVLTGAPAEAPDGGLVAVVHGRAEVLGLARARALQVARQLAEVLPEPQFRPDVALGVEEVLAALESEGLGLL